MATLTSTDQLTMLEVAKRQGTKEIQKCVEALSETNEMLIDAPILEANEGTLQNTVVRTVQPGGTKRLYNEGIAAHASQTKVIQDYLMMLEDYSDVDCNVADHAPNKQALLEGEDMAFVNGMGITLADSLMYGNRAADEADITGFHLRYNALAAGSVKAITTASSGSCTSVFIVKWGPQTVHLFHPRGRSADIGIKREYRGKVDAVKVAAQILPCYRTFFSAHMGLAVRDVRAVKRLCNIKVDGTASGEEMAKGLMSLMRYLPPGPGNVVIYGNAMALEALDEYALTKSNLNYTVEDPWGRPINMFRGARVRQMDAILNTEAVLT